MAIPFEYTPLPPDTDQIRLLTLLPAGEEDEEIVITLQNSPTKAAARRYEALSYVWGSQDNQETVSVVTPGAEEGGVFSSRNTASLHVTQNLAIALRHLRRRDAVRTLWVDAICIDQQNVAERSEQVGKMGQIYRSAARVVVWLGPASPDSDLAMRHADHLGQVLRFDPVTEKLTSTSSGEAESHWADMAQPLPYEEAVLRALEKVFWRPWFERLWVAQEVLLSPETVVVCGRHETMWQSLMLAGSCLTRKPTKTSLSDGFVSRFFQIEMVFDTSFNTPLLELVDHTRGLKCVDGRDKIYALLSIASDGAKIKPDYSLSTIQVYRELAVLSMKKLQMRFLAYCELGSRRLAGPSWIPDWTAERLTSRVGDFNVAAFAWQGAIERAAEGLIRVTAARVGAIVGVDVVSIPSLTDSLILREIARLVPADVECSMYKTGCSLMEAYSGTLLCSNFKPRVPQRSMYLSAQKGADALHSCLRSEDSDGLDSQYIAQVYDVTKNRAVVRTEDGYIGLAPAHVKEGDIILAILSCTSFIVVRPVPGNEGRYQVVGESFVYGLNNGEAVLGPLPGHVHAELHYHPELRRYIEAYRDTRTGRVSWIDPRFEALGIPITTSSHGIPRLVSTDTLEKAGIRLSQIELV